MKTYEYYNGSNSDYILVNSQELNRSISNSEPSQPSSVKRPNLDWLWNSLLNIFDRNSEPRIHQKHDRQGKTYFRVYDPVTGRSSTLNTEQEVRAWLDQRYYD